MSGTDGLVGHRPAVDGADRRLEDALGTELDEEAHVLVGELVVPDERRGRDRDGGVAQPRVAVVELAIAPTTSGSDVVGDAITAPVSRSVHATSTDKRVTDALGMGARHLAGRGAGSRRFARLELCTSASTSGGVALASPMTSAVH